MQNGWKFKSLKNLYKYSIHTYVYYKKFQQKKYVILTTIGHAPFSLADCYIVTNAVLPSKEITSNSYAIHVYISFTA